MPDCLDPILLGCVQRDVRRLTRASCEYRRIARRLGSLAPEATVSRIAGEAVIADLGERGVAEVGLVMARLRVALAAQTLAEGLEMIRGDSRRDLEVR